VCNRFVIQDPLKFSLSRSTSDTHVISNACLGGVKISFPVSHGISNNNSSVPFILTLWLQTQETESTKCLPGQLKQRNYFKLGKTFLYILLFILSFFLSFLLPLLLPSLVFLLRFSNYFSFLLLALRKSVLLLSVFCNSPSLYFSRSLSLSLSPIFL
jgi:hypothetical protein